MRRCEFNGRKIVLRGTFEKQQQQTCGCGEAKNGVRYDKRVKRIVRFCESCKRENNRKHMQRKRAAA